MALRLRVTDAHFTTETAAVSAVNNGVAAPFLRVNLGNVISVGLLIVYSKDCPACKQFAPQMTTLINTATIPIIMYEVVSGQKPRMSELSRSTPTPITNIPTIYLIINSTVVSQIPLVVNGSVRNAGGILDFVRGVIMPQLSQYTPNFNIIQQQPQQFPELPLPNIHPSPPQQQQQPRQQPPVQENNSDDSVPQNPSCFTETELMSCPRGVTIGLCGIIQCDDNTRKSTSQSNIVRIKQAAQSQS